MKRMTCTVTGCGKRSTARRLCRAHYQQAWKAGQLETHAKLPPRLSNPTVCPPDHKHGQTGTCYVHHQCRCSDCSNSRSERDTQRRKLKAYGRYSPGLVDVGPVREHLLFLSEQGMGYKRVAEVAGVSVTAVRNILWGRQDPGPRKGEMPKRVAANTAEAVLKVQPDLSTLAGGALVPSVGTRRRIQALVARGWSLSKLAARLNMGTSNFCVMLSREFVSVAKHRAIESLYDELWNRVPPHEMWQDKSAYVRALNFAKARRWLPPLAWDDIDTDLEPPVVEPVDGAIDEVAVELACAGEMVRLSHAERRVAITKLSREGWSDSKIAERLRLAPRTVLLIRGELGLPAVEGKGRAA